MQIEPIGGLTQASAQQPAVRAPRLEALGDLAVGDESRSDFGQILMGVVQQANADMQSADQDMLDFSDGKTENLQAVVMSTVKADLSFRFILEMRNKLTESYQELSRMQF